MRALLHFVMLLLRCVPALLRSRREQAIVEHALRQQLGTYARKRSGPRLTALDRSFWIALSSFWPPWKEALVVFSHRAVGNFSDPPLVLLLETQERRAPSAKQMSLGSYDALEARFEGVGPGDYVALIEPMPHLI